MNFPGTGIGFGVIRHARMRPAKHAFSYRGFFLRIPIRTGVRQPPGAGSHLPGLARGNRLFAINQWALLSFYHRDHGDRQSDDSAPWIERLLAQQGIAADGDIWLHCFGRILGFAFKPVSFWFCHRADGALLAVLAEVNNTFGETHYYLLSNQDGAVLHFGQELRALKHFHVSPFFPVQGHYRFRFLNTVAVSGGELRSVARIEYWDDEGALLNTSISGTVVPLDNRSALAALFKYPFFSFMVVLNIHWNALRLLARKVPFHAKPTPPLLPLTLGGPSATPRS